MLRQNCSYRRHLLLKLLLNHQHQEVPSFLRHHQSHLPRSQGHPRTPGGPRPRTVRFHDLGAAPQQFPHFPGPRHLPRLPAFAQAGDIVGFADAYPILLIGEASIADLNARLGDPVPIDRFRPNIVVSSQEPFIEDQWGELAVGSALLCGTKGCARCSVPTIDQLTGENTGPEPIRTLSSYRRFGAGIYLGQNLTVRRTGNVSLGDTVSVRNRIAAMYG